MAKQQKTLSPFMRHIEDLYQMEIEDEYRTEAQRTVTFNFPAEDACMLAAIAKRFGRSTAAFGGELFAEHVRELFVALSPADRQQLGAEADAECDRYLQSKGITRTWTGEGHKGQWARYADLCDKVDAEGQANE
jgi:hypothetical protein